ncbi:hypothetical protein WG904_16390 [Pedobacter sp. Du54]|uniref:hypothetical protein n=1 Tax=Pedobacter anseongensis TaxID=3133439 RepID=UPI0030954AC1
MKNIKLMTSLAMLLLFPLISNGQTMQEVELNKIAQVSPDAAALGKYGEYPVGLYTGIPSINIPFYEINSGRIKIPIGISYNAGGIKVEEIASSVGLGWALNAGGVITRSVRGAPDEIAPPGEASFFSTTKTVDSMKTLINTAAPGVGDMLKKIVGSKLDAEPDIFYFNFGGQSGKFMYHQNDGKFYSLPFSKLKIEFTASFGGVTSFTITDENGIIYTFGEMEISTRGITATVSTTTAWYLSTIVDPLTSRTVSFSYNHNVISYQTFSSVAHYYNPAISEEISHKQNIDHSITKINEINFNTGKVKFFRNLSRCDLPGDSAVTEVKVYDIDNQLIKDFDLNYEYFYNGGSTTTCISPTAAYEARLKLLSVSEYSVDGNHNHPETHAFEYNSGLTSRLSFGQDHWGYYNGADGNSNLYPPMQYVISSGSVVNLPGGYREVNPTYAIAGSLNKITYPTKGYTTFELESNTSSSLEAPIIPKPTGIDIPIGSSDYAEGEFTMLGNCNGIINVSVLGFDPFYLPGGYPGLWIKVSYENTDTHATGTIYWVGDGRPDTLDPLSFALPNGNYKIIIDCVGNPYPDSYQNTYVHLTWDSCLPITDMEANNRPVGGIRIKKIKNYDENNSLTTMKYYKYVKEENQAFSSGQSRFYPRYFSYVSYTPDVTSVEPKLCIKRSSQSNYPLVDDIGKSVGYSNVIELNGEDDTNGYTQYKFTNYSEYPDIEMMNLSSSLPVSFQWQRGLETERKVFKFNGSSNELIQSVVNEYDTTLLGNQKKTFEGIRGIFKYTYDDVDVDWPGEDYYFLGAIATNYEYYPAFSDFIYLKKTTSRTYNGGNYVETIKNYTYNTRNLKPTVETLSTSDGQQLGVVTKYPLDYTVTGATHPDSQSILKLQDLNTVNLPIEQYSYKVLPSTDKRLTGANYYSYRSDYGLLDSIFSYNLPNSAVLNYSGLTATASTFSKAAAYEPNVIFNEYDIYNNGVNLLQQKKADGPTLSYLYDYSFAYPVAEVSGAVQNDIAYTSFEAQGKGNWIYSGTSVVDATAPTGKYAYSLTPSTTVVKTGLSSGTTYLLSYWAKNSSSATLSGTTATIVDAKNGWSRYECFVTGVTAVTLSGTVAIDELRLHPKGTLMTTSTYNPLVGISSKTDAKGMTTYYEYDEHKRLSVIKDQNGNILKTYTYHFKP